MIMKNRNFDFLYLLLPIIYITYIIYMRLIRLRIPREVVFFSSLTLLISTIIVISCLFIRLYFLLKQDNIIKTKPTKNKFILKIKARLFAITKVFYESTTGLLRIISMLFSSYDDKILKLVQYLYLTLPSKTFTIIVFSFDIIPKLLVLSTFLIDVFYFKQLNHFYKTLGLLLLPIIFSIIKRMIEQYYIDNIQDLIDGISSEPIPGSEYHAFCFNPERIVPDSVPPLEIHLILHFYPIYEIPYHLGILEEMKQKYHFNKIYIIMCILYIIGWLQILLIGIGLL